VQNLELANNTKLRTPYVDFTPLLSEVVMEEISLNILCTVQKDLNLTLAWIKELI
jgi:hypothetical protein